MNYGKINLVDVANGPGIRVSLFVSGCRNHCPGCFQPETWDFNFGQLFTSETIDEILEALKPDHITGLTILGGDPMEIENRGDVYALCDIVKAYYPNKTIWIYTGYLWEDLQDDLAVKHGLADVVVDGPFVESLKDLSLRFRGSSNQRIIDAKASQKAGHVVLWHDEAYENRMRPSPNGEAIRYAKY